VHERLVPLCEAPASALLELNMDRWIHIAQWIAGVIGVLIVIGALSLRMLSWLLNHPRD
jgi:hypothetical protein